MTDETIQNWREVLGAENVLTDSGEIDAIVGNVSGIERTVPAVIRPISTADVKKIVDIANHHKTSLYPISCGKNWGLGSAAPVSENCAILDLSRMNQIREVDVQGAYAVIEPGVTQGQLYDYLIDRNLPLLLNVTGSGRNTSLIGNCLERGIGYFTSRTTSLSSMEVVLGNGNVVTTGFGHYPQSRTKHIYSPGIGPDFSGLFHQSNYGIVTSAGFDLRPKPDYQCALIAKISKAEMLSRFIDALGDLVRRQVIATIIHVGNRERTRITLCPLLYDHLASQGRRQESSLIAEVEAIFSDGGFGPWSAVIGMMGGRNQVKRNVAEVRTALQHFGAVTLLTDAKFVRAKAVSKMFDFVPLFKRKSALLSALEPLYGLSKGIATDAAVKSVCWPVEGASEKSTDPDKSHSGFLYCLPFLPLGGEVARDAVAITGRICEKHDLIPAITLNMIDFRTLEAVVSVGFDRRDKAQTALAHRCVDELQQTFIDQGYIPYRVGIQSMRQITDGDDTFWQTVKQLKDVLDPNNIIAPGRYNLI